MMNKSENIKRQSGVVLPTVLWIVMACLTVTASYSASIRQSISSLSNSKTSLALGYAARSGLYIALSQLLMEKNKYLENSNIFESVVGENSIKVTVESERNKLFINQASIRDIEILLTTSGIEFSQASLVSHRIVDWRDSNKIRSENGMEDNDYYDAGYKYGAKDKAFSDLEELKLISGIDDKIFQILNNNLSLYSSRNGNVFTLTSVSTDAQKNKVELVAVVKLTGNKNKPYRILKWSLFG